jgi:hypothetical protein
LDSFLGFSETIVHLLVSVLKLYTLASCGKESSSDFFIELQFYAYYRGVSSCGVFPYGGMKIYMVGKVHVVAEFGETTSPFPVDELLPNQSTYFP